MCESPSCLYWINSEEQAKLLWYWRMCLLLMDVQNTRTLPLVTQRGGCQIPPPFCAWVRIMVCWSESQYITSQIWGRRPRANHGGMRCQHWLKLKAEFLGHLSQNNVFCGEENWPRTGKYVAGGRRGIRRWEFRRERFMPKVSSVMLEISYIVWEKFTLENKGGTFWLHNQFTGFIFFQWRSFLSFWLW